MLGVSLTKFICNCNESILQAMKKIDLNTYKFLIIVDGEQKLLGSITDGDIRRHLLAGGKLEDCVLMACNKAPKFATSVSEAEQYLNKHFIAIPIVDNNKKLISIYLGNGDLEIPKESLNVPVVINAGGKGTRLDPYTKILPKPLIPVGDLPIIEHIMQRYQSYDCNDFHIIVNYKKELMKGYFSEIDGKYNITWYDEKTPLGTGGGLSLLKGKIRDPFFFINCDNLLLSDYASILKFHKENHNSITMVCAYKSVQLSYGIVEMGLNGVIESMKEKPNFSFLTNTGIYVVEPHVIDEMQDNVSIGFPDVVLQQKEKGNKVAVYPVSENDWLDMGQLPELEKMRKVLCGE